MLLIFYISSDQELQQKIRKIFGLLSHLIKAL